MLLERVSNRFTPEGRRGRVRQLLPDSPTSRKLTEQGRGSLRPDSAAPELPHHKKFGDVVRFPGKDQGKASQRPPGDKSRHAGRSSSGTAPTTRSCVANLRIPAGHSPTDGCRTSAVSDYVCPVEACLSWRVVVATGRSRAARCHNHPGGGHAGGADGPERQALTATALGLSHISWRNPSRSCRITPLCTHTARGTRMCCPA